MYQQLTITTMIIRDQQTELLKKYLKSDNLIKHSLAVEAILIALAKRLNKPEEIWAATGLLHDLDYDFTKTEPHKHATMSSQILEGILPKEIIDAIKSHNFRHTDKTPVTSLDKALIAADAVSGLVIATALIIPTKKLKDVQLPTLINKFKDISFARNCDRKRIDLCLDFGLQRNEFLNISLQALTSIDKDLGL
jgi:putative nucleotidyltransferase with HDIG domain